MKIAYLPQPTKKSPEYLHYTYFASACAALGHEAVLCFGPDDINAAAPDFVFASHAPNPKQTKYLQIGMMQCPVEFVNKWEAALQGLVSWDGAVTTAASTKQWIDVLLQHVYQDRGTAPPKVGHFFVTCDEQPYQEVYKPEKLVYAGIGWDDRGIALMQMLSQELKDEFEIYGSEEFWRPHNISSYRGFLDTTQALCDEYRRSVCLSVSNPIYLAADVMTTRFHEASSLGIASLTPITPSTAEMYGDSLYYYDGTLSPEKQAFEIITKYWAIKKDPALEQRRRKAYELFCQRHSLRAQLPNLIAYADYLRGYYQENPRAA